jgi:hypothetical protein
VRERLSALTTQREQQVVCETILDFVDVAPDAWAAEAGTSAPFPTAMRLRAAAAGDGFNFGEYFARGLWLRSYCGTTPLPTESGPAARNRSCGLAVGVDLEEIPAGEDVCLTPILWGGCIAGRQTFGDDARSYIGAQGGVGCTVCAGRFSSSFLICGGGGGSSGGGDS